VLLVKQFPTYRGIKQSNKTVLGLLCPEEEGNTIFRNDGIYSPVEIASFPLRLKTLFQ
jgi:hypothetical protein